MVQFGPARFTVVGVERGNYEGLPVSGQITDTFGNWPQWRKDKDLGPHGGVDIAASQGTEVRAPADGEVVTNDWFSEFGNYVTLRHDDDTYSGYCHLVEKPSLALHTQLKRGDLIGHVGMTGVADGPHLHWVHTEPGNSALSRAAGFVNALDSVTDFSGAPIPVIVTPSAIESASVEIYIVKSGDTLGKLSRDWGCSVVDICTLNSIPNANVIRIGQELKKPGR